jgi:3-hydroxyacyl-CoA dehydrogenase
MAAVGIISIGDMGAGVARLLIAHGYRVLTNVSDRRCITQSDTSHVNLR